jgi:uridine kinase
MPKKNYTVIAIVGASASGKSLFAQTIYKELLSELGENNIAIIKEDSYYRAQDNLSMIEREQINYDHPNAFEHELLAEHLVQLGKQQSVEIPNYSYTEHTRLNKTTTQEPAKVILVEGILLLEDARLRELFDIKIFMDIPLDVCLLRRIERDMVERERSLESITQQYMETVRPMYFQYIEPSKAYADIVITQGGKNRMAIEVLKAKIRQLVQ